MTAHRTIPLWAVAATLLAAVAAGGASAADADGWRQARWGMTDAELADAFGGALRKLPNRLQYGNAYAARALEDVELGGLRFIALFQMGAADDRLRQVLLQRRDAQVTPAAYERLLDEMKARYGAPQQTCALPKPDGEPYVFSLTWRGPATTVHATWLDFMTGEILHTDPAQDLSDAQSFVNLRRLVHRFLPRRLVVRYHASGNAVLDPPGCRPPGG
jgi:hypothetical protein